MIPNLYVAVVLLRCDTFTEEAKFITGNAHKSPKKLLTLLGNRPEKVTSGRVVTFRKLKVTTTSHQQQETLFCLKFELRKYSSENEFELLDFIHSNPVCVLSHSTQMKPGIFLFFFIILLFIFFIFHFHFLLFYVFNYKIK